MTPAALIADLEARGVRLLAVGQTLRVDAPRGDPYLQGSCTIDGRRYWISAWTNTVQRGERRGEKYITLSFRSAEERHERELAGRRDDDDLSF